MASVPRRSSPEPCPYTFYRPTPTTRALAQAIQPIHARAVLPTWNGVFLVAPSENVASLSVVMERTAPGLMVSAVMPNGRCPLGSPIEESGDTGEWCSIALRSLWLGAAVCRMYIQVFEKSGSWALTQ